MKIPKEPVLAPMVLKCFIVLACLVSTMLSMGLSYSLSILYSHLIRVFDTERSIVSLNQSFFEALLAVGGALWSYPVFKLGYGYCIIIGGIIGSVCLGLSALATSVSAIIILVGILTGGAFGILYMAPFVVAGDVFSKHREATIVFVSSGGSLGNMFMSFLLEISIEEYNWKGAMVIISAICLNSIPCGLLILTLQRRTETYQKQEDSTSEKRSLFKLSLVKEKMFWLLMANSASLAFAALSESRFLVDIAELKELDRSQGSLLISLLGIGGLFGVLTATVSKVFCKIRSSAYMSFWSLIIIIPHIMVVYADSYVSLVVTSVISGFCIGNIYPHIAAALYEIYGTEDYAPAFAAWNVFKGLGNFLGGVFGGTIHDTTGSYDLLFVISVVLSLLYSVSFIGICIYRSRSSKYTQI